MTLEPPASVLHIFSYGRRMVWTWCERDHDQRHRHVYRGMSAKTTNPKLVAPVRITRVL